MGDFFKEYFYDMSDRLGGYPAGGDNKRSNTARWVDILNGLAFLPMQQQNAGLPGVPNMGGVPNMMSGNTGYNTGYMVPAQQTDFGSGASNESVRNILREIYGLE